MIDEMTSEVKAAIIAHALEEEPRECCGVLIAKGRKQFTRRCRNESDEPEAPPPCSSLKPACA